MIIKSVKVQGKLGYKNQKRIIKRYKVNIMQSEIKLII